MIRDYVIVMLMHDAITQSNSDDDETIRIMLLMNQ